MRGKALIALASIVGLFLPLMAPLPFHEAGASDEWGLLENGGFEDGTEDWHVSHSTTQFVTATQHVHSGQWAASLNLKT